MGRVGWQFWAVVALLMSVAAIGPALGAAPDDTAVNTPSAAAGEEATDAATATSASAEEGACPDEASGQWAGEGAGQSPPTGENPVAPADETAGLPLPDSEAQGTTAGTTTITTDLLANGVTVTNGGAVEPATGQAPLPQGPVLPQGPGLVIPPLWTPNSDRFLLQERQQDLSLAADIDEDDVGDTPAPTASRFDFPSEALASTPATAPRQAKPRKPQTTSKPKPAAAEAPSRPADEDGDPGAAEAAALVGSLELPDAESSMVAEDGSEVIPSEQFSEDELEAAGSDSILLPPGEELLPTEEEGPRIGVIPTSSGTGNAARGAGPSVSEVLGGEAEDPALGAEVPGISPWRSLAVVLVCLAMLFVAIALSKRGFRSPFSLKRPGSLSVIEAISLGPGRQISILEMGESALVLGVTPQSINLLDKVPLRQMGQSYQGTVNAIIAREEHALPAEWQRRPRFETMSMAEAPQLAPLLESRAPYGPSGKRLSVGEYRRQRASGAVTAAVIERTPRKTFASEEETKAELIGRIREHLDRLEE